MLKYLQGKLSVLHQRFLIVQLLQFIKRCDPKRSRGRLKQRFDLVMEAQMTAVKSTFAVSQRIGRRL